MCANLCVCLAQPQSQWPLLPFHLFTQGTSYEAVEGWVEGERRSDRKRGFVRRVKEKELLYCLYYKE